MGKTVQRGDEPLGLGEVPADAPGAPVPSGATDRVVATAPSPGGAVARWLAERWTGLAIRTGFAVVVGFSVVLIIDVASQLIRHEAGRHDRLSGWVVSLAVLSLAIPVGSWQRLRRRGGPRARLEPLSTRDRRRVATAVRRGEDVGEDRLGPAVVGYAQDEQHEHQRGLVPHPWSSVLDVLPVVVLSTWAAAILVQGPARLSVALVVAGLGVGLLAATLIGAHRRARNRRRARALGEPRAARWWEHPEHPRPGDIVLTSEWAPPVTPTLGSWSDAPLWSVRQNDERDPARS